ncbi:MAG: hypothetical protein CMI14_00410, partial [Oleispira sp.]|nr:hypothetical protein [Oleispira sp.]
MKSPDIPVNLTSPLPSSWLLYRFDESIVQKAFEVLPCLKESYICDRVEDIRAAWYKHELKAIIFVIDKHDTSVEDWACRFSMALPEAPLILLSNESSVLDDAKLFELGIQDIWSLEELPSALFPKLVQHSITRKHVEYQTRHLAHYDALTGVANRTLFQDRLDHSLLHARREASVVSLLTIDLDRFSAVNEHYGHDIGDILLKQFAQR